jgi:hypothetical protein
LVTARYAQPPALQETSTYARPFLGRFEREVAQAQISVLEGQHPRAIRSLEEAERALGGARRMALAHDCWQESRQRWAWLSEQPGFEAVRELLTVRMAERSLALAESFLVAGDARKALFLARQFRDALDRVCSLDPDGERGRRLVQRLVRVQSGPDALPPELCLVLGRWIDEGRVELAERLTFDLEIDSTRFEDEGARSARRSRGGALAKIGAVETEARNLAATLAALGTRPPDVTEGEIKGG